MPLIVVTGVDPVAMDSAMLALSWDVPRAVTVRHRIDAEAQVLHRVVSDAAGIVDRFQVDLEHACVSCAVREDIVPTLELLAQDGRWQTIVACLPTGAEAGQLSTIVSRDPHLARWLRLSSVVAAVGTEQPVEDLLCDDLLADRGLHTGPDDDRGIGEVACAQVELADAVLLADDPGCDAQALVRALVRPGAAVHAGVDAVDGVALAAGRHDHVGATRWQLTTTDEALPPLADDVAWRVVLSSPRPFHPERLVEEIATLGSGRHRSRGCFWLPTRPGYVQEWSGAGGQLSIGSHSAWGRRTPLTRIILTGVGVQPPGLQAAFDRLVLTGSEAARDPREWRVGEDGLEPWLGDIRSAA